MCSLCKYLTLNKNSPGLYIRVRTGLYMKRKEERETDKKLKSLKDFTNSRRPPNIIRCRFSLSLSRTHYQREFNLKHHIKLCELQEMVGTKLSNVNFIPMLFRLVFHSIVCNSNFQLAHIVRFYRLTTRRCFFGVVFCISSPENYVKAVFIRMKLAP